MSNSEQSQQGTFQKFSTSDDVGIDSDTLGFFVVVVVVVVVVSFFFSP